MKRIKLKLTQAWLLSAISFVLPMAAEAALVTINNPSFESPVTPPATFSGGQAFGPTDWTVYNSGATNNERFFGVWNPSTTSSFVGGAAPDGVNVGVVFLENMTNLAEAGLEQVLTSTLQLLTQYTLTVEVGNFAPGSGPFNFTGFPGYRVELLAGNTLIASDDNTLTPGEGIFETSVVSFTTGIIHANVGEALAIRLVNLNGPGIEVNFDNVRLDASPVPEPSTVGLVAIGMICALLKRRRTSRNA